MIGLDKPKLDTFEVLLSISFVSTMVALGGTFDPLLSPDASPRLVNYIVLLAAFIAVSFCFYRKCLSIGIMLLSKQLLLVLWFLLYMLTITMFLAEESSQLIKLSLYVSVLLSAYMYSVLFDIEKLIALTFVSLLLVAVVSLVFGVYQADSIMLLDGHFSGLYAQHNSLGRQMIILFIASIALLHKKEYLLPTAGVCLSLFLLFASSSRVSLMAVFVACFVLVLLWLRPRSRVLILTVLFCCSLLFCAFLPLGVSSDGFYFGPFDVSSTGRFDIWSLLLNSLGSHMFWGYGFDSIWSNASLSSISALINWRLTDAHNGYLEILVQFGIFGVIAYALVYLPVYYSIIIRAVLGRFTWQIFYMASIVAVFLLINLVSSQFLEILSATLFVVHIIIFYAVRGLNFSEGRI